MKRLLAVATLLAAITSLLAATTSTAQGHIARSNAIIYGVPEIGRVLYAKPGRYAEFSTTERRAKTEITYQWLSDGTPLEGETGKSIFLDIDLVGKRISVAVTMRKGDHDVTTVSDPTKPLAGVLTTGPLRITGDLIVGEDLTLRIGDGWGIKKFYQPREGYNPSYPTHYFMLAWFRCQWFADGVLIRDVTSFTAGGGPAACYPDAWDTQSAFVITDSYVLQPEDRGKRISAKLTIFRSENDMIPKSASIKRNGLVYFPS